MMKKEKVAFITGGGKRIGSCIARYFHGKGFKVLLHFNESSSHAIKLKEELSEIRENSCETVQANFFSESSLKQALASISKKNKKLDVLINNASSYFPTPIEIASKEDWKNLLDTNATAPFFLIQSLKPMLKASKGCVINISDSLVSSGIKDFSLYAAAKAALESITKSLAKELAPEIRVNAVAPGIILWPEENELSEEIKLKIINKTSVGRIGTPEDIAAASYFLYQSTYITGQVLNVDGGRSLV